MYRKTIVLLGLAITFFLLQSTEVNAATPEKKNEIIIAPTATPTAVPKVDYTLPYPGILPDHPLYFLKNLRDKIMAFLIRDPLKRVEFNILMADKRLNMGIMFSEQSKNEKAGSIIAEGEQFMTSAISEGKKTKEQGREVRSDIIKKLENSLAKHKEVIADLLQKGPESVKQSYEKAMESIAANQEQIPSLSK